MPSRRNTTRQRPGTTSRRQSATTDTTASGKSKLPFKFNFNKKVLINFGIWLTIFFVSLIAVDFGVQYLNYKASAALVNGERIYRGEFHRRLEQYYGKQIIADMIDETLLRQQGAESKIKIETREVEKVYQDYVDQFGGEEELKAQLEQNQMTKKELFVQIENNLMVEELLGKDIEMTDEEKKEFYEQYKDQLVPGNENPTYEEAKDKVEEYLKDSKLKEEYSSWIVEIREKAKVQDNMENPKDLQFLGITRSFFNQLIGK